MRKRRSTWLPVTANVPSNVIYGRDGFAVHVPAIAFKHELTMHRIDQIAAEYPSLEAAA